MEKDLIFNGVVVAEYGLSQDEIIPIIKKKEVLESGMNYIRLRTDYLGEDWDKLIKEIEYLRDNKIFFDTYISGNLGEPRNELVVEKIKKVAGKYWLGVTWAEPGSTFGVKGAGYNDNLDLSITDMNDGKNKFISFVNEKFAKTGLDKDYAHCIEASGLMPYLSNADVGFPWMELVYVAPEIMTAMTRGTAKTMKSDIWATHIAHEWYGGMNNHDELKKKRLKMGYYYTYISGSNGFVLESGDECILSHGDKEDGNSELSNFYRDTIKEFAKFVKNDSRPKGGPKVKVAFVYGNCDAWSPWRSGSSLWGNHGNKEFGYSSPEYVWRIMDEIINKRSWSDVHNYGEVDLSGAPAYGIYDIIPATADAEVMRNYDYLIFVGWNSMTKEIYNNLKIFVENGGRLFMTSAHLNMSVKRNGEINLINDGNVEDLFGCILNAENITESNDGYKMCNSIVPEFIYPAEICNDPLFSDGYIKYPGIQLKDASIGAICSDNFTAKDDVNLEKGPVAFVENKVGNGYAMLMTGLEYPSGAMFPLYRTIIREILNASHRNASVKVYGGDKLRFSVYDGDKIYLLNTDFDCKTHAIVDYGCKKKEFLLEPCELMVVEK